MFLDADLAHPWGAPLFYQSDFADTIAARHKELALEFANDQIIAFKEALENAVSLNETSVGTIMPFDKMMCVLFSFKISILEDNYSLFKEAVISFKEDAEKHMDSYMEMDIAAYTSDGFVVHKKGTELARKAIQKQLQYDLTGVEIMDTYYGNISKIRSEMQERLPNM